MQADIPCEVLRPHVEEVYNQFKITRNDNRSARFPGLAEMSEVIGVSHKTLYNILGEERPAFNIETCDKIAYHGDFSLNDLYEETLEWAQNNPEANWPANYLKDGRKRRRKKDKKEKT